MEKYFWKHISHLYEEGIILLKLFTLILLVILTQVNMQKRLKLYMGLDYEDGSTAFQQTTFNGEGWHRCKLQSDSRRDVKRVYGYLEYESQPQKTVFIDSVEMLRTHLDKRGYTTALRQQKWIIDRALVKDEKLVFNEKKVDMVDDKLELIEAEELENPHPLQYK